MKMVGQQEGCTCNYKEALAYLDSLQFHKIKLGLAPMREFLSKVGNPENSLKIIHTAGTNGKGSVCAGVVSVLQKAGYRTGFYTSPHLSSPRERFRVNEEFISKEDFARLTAKIRSVLVGGLITYFEFTTALALLWFEEQKVDFVVLETGLGGRLDATNVIEKPILTIITSISMDHEMYLGDTIELVASEKAGIIKQNVPVVCGNRDQKVVAVIREKAKSLNAPLFCLGRDFEVENFADSCWGYRSFTTNTGDSFSSLQNAKPGFYQAENNALVVTAIHLLNQAESTVTESQIRAGLLDTKWPGRLESIEFERGSRKFKFLLDGAHNPAGVKGLTATLADYSFDRLICVWGAMADKNITGGLAQIAAHCDYLLLTDVDSERSAKSEEMFGLLTVDQKKKTVCCSTSQEALMKALDQAEESDLILIAGSLYLIGEIRPLLVGELAS